MNEAERFYEKVAEMRHAQKKYFQTRSNDALEKSKKLEREVDKMLKERGQTRLFDE